MLSFDPSDRVLFAAIPAPATLAACSLQTPQGIVVALGPREDVYDARVASAELDNVMIVPATLDEIPWQEAFFSWVIVEDRALPLDRASAREIARVLVPEGRVRIEGPDASLLVEAGLLECGGDGSALLLRKPPKLP